MPSFHFFSIKHRRVHGTVLSLALGYLGAALAADPVVLQLRWKHQFQFAGYYAALEQGYYQQAGLEVRIQEANDDTPTPLESVLAGKAQYAVGNAGLIASRMQGKPIVALAAILQRSPNIWLIRKEANVFNPIDLASKRLMMTKTIENTELLTLFANEGIDSDQLNIQSSNFQLTDLIDGNVDAINAYISNEPYLLQQAGIPFTIIDPHDYSIDFYSDVLFTSEQEVKLHPERVKAFRQASLKGWQYALAHPDAIVDLILTKYNTQHKSRDHLLYEAYVINQLTHNDLIEIGHMNAQRWKMIADNFVRFGWAPAGKKWDGFLYNPNPKPDLQWLYNIIAFLLILTTLTLGYAFVKNRFNQKLARQIEERIQAETSLQHSNQVFTDVLNGIDIAIYVVDTQNQHVLFANKAAVESFGELVHRPCYETIRQSTKLCGDCRLQPEHQNTPSDFIYYKEFFSEHNQRWYGTHDRLIDWFDNRKVLIVTAIDITEQRSKQESVNWEANHDTLTRLANRRLLTETLDAFVTKSTTPHREMLAVVFIDLDGFKAVNDNLGHQVGDQLLISVAHRLEGIIRADDLVARLGGDEFVILLTHINTEQELPVAVTRIIQHISAPYLVHGNSSIHIQASAGIAIYPNDDQDPHKLIELADKAMYHAKKQNGCHYAFYHDIITAS